MMIERATTRKSFSCSSCSSRLLDPMMLYKKDTHRKERRKDEGKETFFHLAD
jgi:hypothetical protein